MDIWWLLDFPNPNRRQHGNFAPMTPTGQIEMDFDKMKAARDAGIAQSYGASPQPWKDLAYDILETLAQNQQEVVSDDVWNAGLPHPPNSGTALGGVFKRAAKAGLIVKTDRVRITAQVKSHGSPMTVWRSLVYTP